MTGMTLEQGQELLHATLYAASFLGACWLALS